MKKSILASSMLFAAASMLCAQEDMIPYESPLITDVTGVLYADKAYVIGADGVTITHNRTAARHLNSSFSLDAKSFTGTELVSDSVIGGGGTGTTCFGFNGLTFKGNGKAYDITVTATEEATKVGILDGGFKVDNVTVNLNLVGKSYFTHSNSTITVKNNGVLNWNSIRPSSAGRTIQLTVEQGSEFNATFDDSTTNGSHWRNANIAGRFYSTNANTLSFYNDNSFSHQTAANASELGGRISLDGANATMTISDSEVKSIIMSGSANVILRQATLTLNSSNVLGRRVGETVYGQDYINLEVGLNSGNPSAAAVVLGADNAFNNVWINSSADSSLSFTLNGHKLDLNGLSTSLIGTIYIADFAEDLVKIANVDSKFYDENFLLSNVKAGTSESASDLYWNSATGYLSAMPIPVPEPAAFAALFGALALGFACYRRRK